MCYTVIAEQKNSFICSYNKLTIQKGTMWSAEKTTEDVTVCYSRDVDFHSSVSFCWLSTLLIQRIPSLFLWEQYVQKIHWNRWHRLSPSPAAQATDVTESCVTILLRQGRFSGHLKLHDLRSLCPAITTNIIRQKSITRHFSFKNTAHKSDY